ncbi:MAG: Crp/Fnr family transcriptional regulator [Actinomycetota bacterium]
MRSGWDEPELLDTLFRSMEAARATFLRAIRQCGGKPVEYGAGTFLFHQGEPAEDTFVVEDGRAKVGRLMENGSDLILGIVGPGDFVGLSETLIGIPHVRYARTITDAYVWRLAGPTVNAILETDTEFMRAMITFPALRFLESQLRLTSLRWGPVRARLVQLLVRLAHESGPTLPGRGAIPLHLTQEEMASAIGTTRQSVSSLLNILKNAGLVSIDRHRIDVPDWEALIAWAAVPLD